MTVRLCYQPFCQSWKPARLWNQSVRKLFYCGSFFKAHRFYFATLSLKVLAVCKQKMQFVSEPCVKMCSWILEIKDFVQSHWISSSFLSDCCGDEHRLCQRLLSFQSLTSFTCPPVVTVAPNPAITWPAHPFSQLFLIPQSTPQAAYRVASQTRSSPAESACGFEFSHDRKVR